MAAHRTSAADRGRDRGWLRVEVEGRRVRVLTPEIATPWRPETLGHRQLAVVWGRLLVDDRGQPWDALQDVAPIVGRTTRQAASQHLEDVRQGEEDRRALVVRPRQGEATVVDGVLPERLQTPLVGPTGWLARVQRRLGRQARSVAKSASALAQISWVPELLAGHALPTGLDASHDVPRRGRGRRLADPTALTALVTPDLPRAEGPGSLGWLSVLMTRFSWQGPLSGWGRWCGVQKTTI